MPVALVRRGLPVNVRDAEAVRAFLKEQIALEVKLKGQPRPRILVVGDGFEESLDLSSAMTEDPAAGLGATFHLLAARPEIERQYVLMRLDAQDESGAERTYALLFEEIRDYEAPRRWWLTTLPYATDPTTALGHLLGSWEDAPYETDHLEDLYPFLQAIAVPTEDERPARVLPPRRVQPDIRMTAGELPPEVAAPADAKAMMELVAHLAIPPLLSGELQGTIVVRIAGRAWELWALAGELPTELEDMVRYIANQHAAPADGVGIAMVAIVPEDEPPRPAVQVLAEKAGMFVDTRALLRFPEGPRGPKVLEETRMRGPLPVPERGMWLGVEAIVNFELGIVGPVG